MTSPTTSKPAIGLIGCGRMGIGLCRNLLAHGHPVVAMDPHPASLERAVELGATAAKSLDNLLQSCGIILTCLPTDRSIIEIYEGKQRQDQEQEEQGQGQRQKQGRHDPEQELGQGLGSIHGQDQGQRQGSEQGLDQGLDQGSGQEAEKGSSQGQGLVHLAAPGTLIIETSSADPTHRRALAQQAAARGVALVDAPMLKSAADAWAGTIQMLVGGEPEAVARARPVLQCVAEKLIDAGPLGTAHIMKALNNAVTLANHAILFEIYFAAQRLGIPGAAMFETMRGSMAASYKLEDLAPKLLNNSHPRNTNFTIATKDLEIGAELVHGVGLEAPVLSAVLASFQHACRTGGSDEPVSLMGHYLLERNGTP